MVDKRRSIPNNDQIEIGVGTKDAGFCHSPLGDFGGAAVGQSILEMVDHEVAGVVREEETGIESFNDLVTRVITELVEGSHVVVVSEVRTGGI